MSLRKKIIVSVILIILFFGSLAVGAVFSYSRSSLIENRKEDLKKLITAQSFEVNQVFNSSSELVKTIAKQEFVHSYFEGERQLQNEEALRHLGHYNIGGKYSTLCLFDLEGNVLVSTDPSFLGQNYAFRSYFKESAAGSLAVEYALGVTSHKPGYYFSYPIENEEKQIIGVVVAKMDAGVIDRTLAVSDLPESKIMLADDLGVVIYSSAGERTYKSLGPVSEEIKNLIAQNRRYEGLEIASLQYEILQNNLSGVNGAEVFQLFDEKDGEEELLGAKRIGAYDFYLVIETGYERYVGSAVAASVLLGLFVLLSVLFAGSTLSLLINKFLKPLDLIEKTAIRVTGGEVGVRMDENQVSSELKGLAHAFNEMIDSVLGSKKEINKRVEEQVAEIKEKNKEIEDQQKATINILEDINNSQEELKLRYKELDVIKSLTQKLGDTLEGNTVMNNISFSLQELFPEATISFVLVPISAEEKMPAEIKVVSSKRLKKAYLEEIKRWVKHGFDQFPLYLKKQKYWKSWTGSDFSLKIDESLVDEERGAVLQSHMNIPIAIPNTLAGIINISSGADNFFEDQRNAGVVEAIIANAVQTIERLKILVTSEHSRLQDLVESMRTGVVMFGANRQIIVANSSAKSMLNIRNKDYSLDNILQFVKRGKFESGREVDFSEAYANAVQKGKIQKIDSLELDRRFYEIVITPVNDLQKEVSGGAIIIHDITHLKEIDRMKTEFVSVASHQLRTPLTAINWYVEMLQSGDAGRLNKEQKVFLDEIYKGSVRMVKLVNELLNVSRLETGRLKISPKPVYLDSLIEDVIHELEAMAEKNSCKIVFKKAKKRLDEIALDETLMRQVIHNLITNAIRYSPNQKGEVIVALSKKEGDYVVSVADQGIGIPQEAQNKIFQKFFRADNARKKEGEGSGIGLYIAKMIMEASMGKIWFKSPTVKVKNEKGKMEGRGTTFYASIPQKGMLAHEGERELAV